METARAYISGGWHGEWAKAEGYMALGVREWRGAMGNAKGPGRKSGAFRLGLVRDGA